MIRCSLVGVGLALASSWSCRRVDHAKMSESVPPPRPNIIIVMADDLGYGELGCYGSDKIQTPRIDQMAREGIKFTQAYSGNTLCAPSRCTLLTGLHTGHCLVRANVDLALRPEDVTVAEVLRKAGYRTAVIGKWGLGEAGSTGVPTKQGFDFFYGVLTHFEAHNYYPEFVYRNEEREYTGNALARTNVARVKVGYFPDLCMREIARFIDESKEIGKPFFMYLPFTLPHINNEQDPEYQNEIPSLGVYSDKPWTHANKGHAAMVTLLDKLTGQIIDKLKTTGLDSNTLVIFTCDNGPLKVGGVDPAFFKSSGDLRGYKRDMWEGGMRVPFVVRWPGHSPRGVVEDRPTASWDLMPTFAELAGYKGHIVTDGVSLAPNLMGKPNARGPKPMFWVVYEGGYRRAARIGDWKLIWTKRSDSYELYDLNTDPGESHNLADERRDVVRQLREYMEHAWSPPAEGAIPQKTLDEI